MSFQSPRRASFTCSIALAIVSFVACNTRTMIGGVDSDGGAPGAAGSGAGIGGAGTGAAGTSAGGTGAAGTGIANTGAGGVTGGGGTGASLASAACLRCEKEECTTEAFIHSNPFALSRDREFSRDHDLDLYDLCYPKDPRSKNATDLPTAGPAAGTGVTRAELCREAIGCIRGSKCNALHGDFDCYCGTAAPTDCLAPGGANGPCKNVFEAAAESTVPFEVVTRRYDLPQPGTTGNALGYALSFLYACEAPPINNNSPGPCVDECATAPGPVQNKDGGTDTAPGASTGAAGSDGAADAGGAACHVTHRLGAGCQTCELAALRQRDIPKCGDLSVLTASPPDSDGEPVGFGLDTLPTRDQQDAAYALVRRIKELLPVSIRNSQNTAYAVPGSDDVNVVNGVLKLGASNASLLFSGTADLLPPSASAWEAYKAAAFADARAPRSPGAAPGLPVTATDAEVARYLSVWAVSPTSALGLADNILACAMNARGADPRCGDCFDVTTTTTCDGGTGD